MSGALPELGLCILSWRNRDKLRTSLESYRANGLFELFGEIRILFQAAEDEDYTIAREFGLEAIGLEQNIGIAGAWEYLLRQMKSHYVVFMENDCPLVEGPETVERELRQGLELLQSWQVDVYRLRSRTQPGSKFYNCEKYRRYYPVAEDSAMQRMLLGLRRLLRPGKAKRLLGSAPYCVKNADRVHPQIRRLENGVYIVPSAHLNWTNQSVMFEREWMLDVLLERVKTHPSNRSINGFQDIEMALNCPWWRQQGFRIGLGEGLFTHL